ncbi:MAG: thiamine pyrophosphate-dependent dehydrogenase E1 component subunit alpha, partial [Alphaproteobacteria bacterium]|nr:thiamine pyrophosphate-dependent dehydrogenase E1 component subunit alpha [Alphaproteobacteria bacterium]
GLLADVRAGKGPRLLHARTTRVKGHIVQDQGAYRAAGDAAANRARDPIALLSRRLIALGVPRGALDADIAAARREMDRVRAKALAAPHPKRAGAFADVQDSGDGQWL